MKRKWLNILIVQLICLQIFAQNETGITVNVSTNEGKIEPLWGDHYEMHLLFGWGGNPLFTGNHQQFIGDTSFASEMDLLKPRYIRVSTGRFENPPDTSYFSENPEILKNLWTEFYLGENTLQSANDIGNYDFSYVDSLVKVVQSTGAEPFLEMAYMPFVLSSDTTANYIGTVPLTHLYSWDNSIRNSPPANMQVYAKVMYKLIKHLNFDFGVEYFELWNEPDQLPLNTFFWKGNAQELFEMYEAVATEIEADSELSTNIKIGCCGFALNSPLQLFPINFLSNIQSNSTRMDFLSFHPYSANDLGGYDTSRVNLVKQWRDTYAPDAKLINSEWGILSASFGSNGWNDLDYGLEKTKAIIDMNHREIKMAHQATLADTDITSNSCCLGMFYVDPEFSPKPSAFVYTNLNKFLAAPIRLNTEVNSGGYALAGRSESGDTIVVVYPADNPQNDMHEVSLTIDNLPWTEGKLTRYELTESSYSNNVLFNITATYPINANSINDSFYFSSDQNSGRLIIWELVNSTSVNTTKTDKNLDLQIYPNPTDGLINIELKSMSSGFNIFITDLLGKIQYSGHFSPQSHFKKQIYLEERGLFFISIISEGNIITKRIKN